MDSFDEPLVPWAKKHHMEKNVDVFRVNKIAIPKNREVSRMNNSLAYSPSWPCFSKTESISQLVFRCNHVNTNSEILLHLTYVSKANRYLRQSDCLHTFPRLIDIAPIRLLTYVSKANRYLRQSDCFFSWKIEFNPTYKWNWSAQNDMSEDVYSSTFPRVTDICANQVAPFLSRSRVFE